MKTNIFIIILILLCSCNSQKPIATTHIERIEEKLMPVAVGADTIEITEYRLRSTDLTPSPTENAFGDFLLARHNTNEFAFCSCFVRQFPLKQGENMRANQFSANAQKHDSPILSPCLRGTSNAEGGKIKSTRAVNIERTKTDTTSTLRITLQPDTVFVPYTNHIRSDTIVVPDKICNEKLKQTKFMNVILLIILILLVATIIYKKILRR